MKNLSTIIILLFLASCSGETVTTRLLTNNSDKNLKMVIYRNGSTLDTINLISGQSYQLSISTADKGSDAEPDCVWEIDSAYTKVEGGGILHKEIENIDNWDSESEKVKTVPPNYENSCVFNIYNADIE